MHSETPKQYIEKLMSQVLKGSEYEAYFDHLNLNIVPPADPNFGDYSTNIALLLSKQLKRKPSEIAKNVIEKFKTLSQKKVFSEIYEAKGFINFRLSNERLLENLALILESKENYGGSQIGQGKTMVVEYFQNNVAKPPHVGHLRSAVIGDSLLRVLRLLGFMAMSDTHIGDWGVQFGILLYAYKEFIKAGGKKAQIEKDPINELNKLYVEMSAKIESDETLREKGKEEFAKLEKGNAENRKLWQWFVLESVVDFEKYRQLLGLLSFDHNLGESFYEDKMPEVLKEFKEKNLITVGETGEQYVDLEKYGLGRAILVKSDNATTYLLRDFACYIYRKRKFDFYKNIYVVDNRQSHHFEQLFKVLEMAGYKAGTDSAHVDFGFMSLPEGAISTRKGTTVSLKNLLDEAVRRALEIIKQKNPNLKNKEAVAQEVALAAIKYFDLSHNRKTEIVFTWEKALSFEGNTGPYLQYAHARIFGILRKCNFQFPISNFQTNLKFQISNLQPQEELVLRKLIQFPEVLEQVAATFLPNLLCNYLFELSQILNTFYESCPVLQEKDENIKNFRLQLITATAQVISNGLYLLGIEAPEEM